jgi:phospholipid transport system transporter-binding protein
MRGEQAFKPSHELTFETVQLDSQRLLKLLRETTTTGIRLDLCEVVQCDSAGLALLIEAKRLCKQHGKSLIIEGIPNVISALAEFCGVETMLDEPLMTVSE